MGIAIECHCGEQVRFVPEGEEEMPVTEVCDGCGREWELQVRNKGKKVKA